ncbi:pyridoxamine 5'-phosphate oxidase family protein [Chitinophaga alhagiae]|uniref:pyridoxamine 5'-phosphate oxidase family protein n=1 Tax=Chitinophaga alhagiae TaxID=2203219 RepID=UPI0013009E81|nr:pyridoxamine 5'-phosphate oxidase family protein [Chitinophaga alhagiae]
MLGTLTPEQMDDILLRHAVGRIACTDGLMPYVVPVSYAFNGTYLAVHSRPGEKIDIMRKNPNVWFLVDEIDDLANWRSVMIRGEYEEVMHPKERYYAMKFLVGNLQQRHVSETAGIAEMTRELGQRQEEPPLVRHIVYRIRIMEKTGRFEKRLVGR